VKIGNDWLPIVHSNNLKPWVYLVSDLKSVVVPPRLMQLVEIKGIPAEIQSEEFLF